MRAISELARASSCPLSLYVPAKSHETMVSPGTRVNTGFTAGDGVGFCATAGEGIDCEAEDVAACGELACSEPVEEVESVDVATASAGTSSTLFACVHHIPATRATKARTMTAYIPYSLFMQKSITPKRRITKTTPFGVVFVRWANSQPEARRIVASQT